MAYSDFTLRKVKQAFDLQSVFSGRDFTVEPSLGLNDICDFLISRSAEQLEIEAPAVVLNEYFSQHRSKVLADQ